MCHVQRSHAHANSDMHKRWVCAHPVPPNDSRVTTQTCVEHHTLLYDIRTECPRRVLLLAAAGPNV